MQHKILCLVLLSASLSIAGAQTENKFYRVNFNVDKHELDESSTAILNDVLKEFKKSSYSELYLSAHTDNHAGDQYNMQLSHLRAETVYNYLLQNGVDSRKMETGWYGERKPEASNTNEEGRAENRRVDIELRNYHFNSTAGLLKSSSPGYTQTFTILTNKDSKVTGKNGIIIQVPKEALVTKDGKPVSSSEVKLELQEFLKPADAVFNQLSTMSNGKLLESGGMFTISATAGGEELKLKEGKTISVQIPSKKIQSNMELFVAEKNADGVVTWKATGKPFAAGSKTKIKAPYAKLNTACLKSLLTNPDLSEAEHHQTGSWTFERPPMKPVEPKEPRQPEPPALNDMFSFTERLFLPKKTKEKRINEALQKADEKFDERMDRYQEKMDRYCIALKKYAEDSVRYESSSFEKFRKWLLDEQQYHEKSVHAIQQQCLNNALKKFIALSDSNQFTSTDPENLFAGYVWQNPKLNNLLNRHRSALLFIKNLLPMNRDDVYAYADKGVITLTERKKYYGSYYDYGYYNREDDFLKNQPGLKQLFTNAQQQVLDQREKLGLSNNTDVDLVYTASLSGFGMYNCDRFSDYPKNQMITINMRYNGEAKICLYVPVLNSYVYAQQNNDNYSFSLPRGMEATVVFVAFDETQGPLFFTDKKIFNYSESIKAQPKPVTLRELREGLASL